MFVNKTTTNEPKQAKIVKLNHSKPTFSNSTTMSTPFNSTSKTLTRSDSFETESNYYSELDEQENDVSGESLSKLWVIKDYKRGELIYGDISVKKGQVIYLICESDFYYFIETEHGKQGFVPKEACVNLEEMTRQVQLQESFCKITSL